MEIYRAKNSETAKKKASKELQSILEENKDTAVLFLSSGGSALSLLEDIELKNADNLTISVLDERYTFKGDESNFVNLAKTNFMKSTLESGAKIIDSRPEDGESLEDAAIQFEQALKVWRVRHPEGKIIVTMGVGSDGHTAGIFPFPDEEEPFHQAFLNPERFVFGYEVPPEASEFTKRMTTTMSFLTTEVDVAVVYIAGSEKKEALMNIEKEKGSLNVTPSLILNKMKKVFVYTDIEL
jgi:6-phosphogluconolactonase/glucosamine-6-phosphate isomerase/deaminase